MEPPLHPDIAVIDVEGRPVVVVEVPDVAVDQRPCFIKASGLQTGSYIRVGPSNRRMSEYQIFGYLSSRSQPVFDREPVAEATLDDLDAAAIDAYIAQVRRDRGDVAWPSGSRTDILRRARIAVNHDGEVRPTMAGLLVFGQYPQEFFPQLMVSFVQFYGTTEDENTPTGARYLDNRTFDGALPRVVDAAVRHVLSRIGRSSLIDGIFRRDTPEYPEKAIREAVINAVAHRDYSHYVRGSHIHIRLFADRLEIRSPGGLFGNVTIDTIDEAQSARNATLAKLLEEVRIVENHGRGIGEMNDACRSANLEPPKFADSRDWFSVTFLNHTLMNPDAYAWLNRYATFPLNDHQRVALVYLRTRGQLTNSEYRRLNHVDMTTASNDLRGLVRAGAIEPFGSGRWSYYELRLPVATPVANDRHSDEEQILEFVARRGSITNAECRELLGITYNQASYLLGKMHRSDRLRRVGSGRWISYRLPGSAQ